MKRQTLVAVMAILDTDPSVTDEQSDLVADVLAGRLCKRDFRRDPPHPIASPPPIPASSPATPPKELMNSREAARYLGVCDRYVFSLKTNGDLAFIHIGRKVMFKRSDLDAFMSSRRVAAGDRTG